MYATVPLPRRCQACRSSTDLTSGTHWPWGKRRAVRLVTNSFCGEPSGSFTATEPSGLIVAEAPVGMATSVSVPSL